MPTLSQDRHFTVSGSGRSNDDSPSMCSMREASCDLQEAKSSRELKQERRKLLGARRKEQFDDALNFRSHPCREDAEGPDDEHYSGSESEVSYGSEEAREESIVSCIWNAFRSFVAPSYSRSADN